MEFPINIKHNNKVYTLDKLPKESISNNGNDPGSCDGCIFSIWDKDCKESPSCWGGVFTKVEDSKMKLIRNGKMYTAQIQDVTVFTASSCMGCIFYVEAGNATKECLEAPCCWRPNLIFTKVEEETK